MALAFLEKLIANVLGNKNSTTHTGAVDNTTDVMGYVKQIVTNSEASTNNNTIPTVDSTDNATIRDVIGNKGDTASTTINNTSSIVAYIKHLIGNQSVPSVNSTVNTHVKDVVGNKTDAASTGAVSNTASLVAYAKQNVTNSEAAATAIAAINSNIGNPSARTNSKSIEALLGLPDTVGQTLYNIFNQNGYDSSSVISAATGSIFQRLAYARSIAGDSSATALYTISGTNTIMGLSKGLVDITEKAITRTTANIPQTTTTSIFTVTGAPIEIISIVGEVTTAIQNQANSMKLLILDTASSTSTDICASLNIANAAVGTFFSITGTLANAMVSNVGGVGVAQTSRIICPVGSIRVNTTASNTGQVRWYLRYRPLGTSAVVTAV